jgi:hypothetical protein
MSDQRQPARRSARILMGEQQFGCDRTDESVAFARRRNNRRERNKMAKASRKKNR